MIVYFVRDKKNRPVVSVCLEKTFDPSVGIIWRRAIAKVNPIDLREKFKEDISDLTLFSKSNGRKTVVERLNNAINGILPQNNRIYIKESEAEKVNPT